MRKQQWITRAVLGASILTIGLLEPFAVKGQIFFGGATEITQLLNHLQLVFSYLKEAQTALHAIQMARIMTVEGVNLVRHPSVNITQDLMNLQGILMASQGLAGDAAQIDTKFRTQYAPYSPSPIVTYAGSYDSWAKSTMRTLDGTLRNAGMQSNMLQNQQVWMQQIEAMNQTPMGRNESIQLGNTIGLQTVKSLMALQQLMIQDSVSKQAVAAGTLNVQQATQTNQQGAFYYPGITADQSTF